MERSALRGHANYGYCASHSRYFWGFKLYLLTTPDGLVVDWCLADPKLGEAEVAEVLLDGSPLQEGQIIVCDKGFADRFLQESPSRGPLCSAPIARMSLPATALWAQSGSGSRASSTPSKGSSRSKSTAPVLRPGLGRGSARGCWRSGPMSGGTGRSTPLKSVLWLLTTIESTSNLRNHSSSWCRRSTQPLPAPTRASPTPAKSWS